MVKKFCNTLFIVLFGSSLALAEGWENYTASDYGFSMLIPTGTVITTKTFGGGWGGLKGEHDGVLVVGVAKLGEQASAQEIEAFGVDVTGIPADYWTEVDSGSGDGWNWYKTVLAKNGSRVVYGGYGTGPKGSFLLLIETTASDFEQYRSEYEKWYNSIRLH